jgi:hypothetical protein
MIITAELNCDGTDPSHGFVSELLCKPRCRTADAHEQQGVSDSTGCKGSGRQMDHTSSGLKRRPVDTIPRGISREQWIIRSELHHKSKLNVTCVSWQSEST